MRLSLLRDFPRVVRRRWFSPFFPVMIASIVGCVLLNSTHAKVPCKPSHHPWVKELSPELSKLAPQIPIAFLLGWIQIESGGNLSSTTSLDERGYFQLMPDESQELNLDHQRLSTDSEYSLQGGIKLVELYAKTVERLGYSRTDPDFWHIVKFEHAIGSGSVTKLLKDMESHHVSSRSWATIQQYSKDNHARLLDLLGHDPVKWTASVNKVFAAGNQLEQELHESCPSAQSGQGSAGKSGDGNPGK